MKEALESGRSDERAGDRLRAVLRATLKVAEAEQRHNTNALVFVGAFGLNVENCPPVVDLCGVIDALLVGHDSNKTGRELLIELAEGKDVGYISEYIKKKFSDDEARILYAFLQRRPHRVDEFVNAIPSEEKIKGLHTVSRTMDGLAPMPISVTGFVLALTFYFLAGVAAAVEDAAVVQWTAQRL